MELRHEFAAALEDLNQDILKMGVLVEEALRKAVAGLVDQDRETARQVIEEDEAVNEMEVHIEDKCTVIIARDQPVASDLRQLITSLKVVTQLERMGDHAVHIAKAALRLADKQLLKPLIDIPQMGELCIEMARKVISAYIECDAEEAEKIAGMDEKVDDLRDQVMRELISYMLEDTKYISQSLDLLFVSRYLERFADHVTNIAEWIVYNATGRHTELNL
jgi:phosphate transport system protein